MTQTRWWWIRHAPVTENNGTIYGNQDLNCDCSNKAAFKALASVVPQDAVWVTSNLKRTHQTAEAVRAEMSTSEFPPFTEIHELQEQSFGNWQGMTHTELGEIRGDAWHRFWLAPAAEAPPGGESFEALMYRTSGAIDKLNNTFKGRDIIAVTHGGTIRAAVAKALGLSSEKALGLTVGNLSLTKLDHYGAEDDPIQAHSSWGIGCVNAEPLQFQTP
ncbi:histidine phosphatase family protein [Kiloniella sp.]|uniref:histidine phosphatase family protein n=1 Tax=Kiloniella sp. TaxID=1938587 RepID=UPI003B01A212